LFDDSANYVENKRFFLSMKNQKYFCRWNSQRSQQGKLCLQQLAIDSERNVTEQKRLLVVD
jgi:hypothetical protein